ncbi:hypothetical protein CsSME_00022407 [Camellia sinensis var. sinensis]
MALPAFMLTVFVWGQLDQLGSVEIMDKASMVVAVGLELSCTLFLLHFQSLNTCSLNTCTLNTRTALRFIGVVSSRFKWIAVVNLSEAEFGPLKVSTSLQLIGLLVAIEKW